MLRELQPALTDLQLLRKSKAEVLQELMAAQAAGRDLHAIAPPRPILSHVRVACHRRSVHSCSRIFADVYRSRAAGGDPKPGRHYPP